MSYNACYHNTINNSVHVFLNLTVTISLMIIIHVMLCDGGMKHRVESAKEVIEVVTS